MTDKQEPKQAFKIGVMVGTTLLLTVVILLAIRWPAEVIGVPVFIGLVWWWGNLGVAKNRKR